MRNIFLGLVVLWNQFSILILCVISMTTFHNMSADAQIDHVDAEDFTVKVIYFKPVGSEHLEEKISDKMEKAQQFYQDEMIRHGFEPKTFRLARDESGNVKIHVINAEQPALEYETDTENKVFDELPNELKNINSINVVFVGAIDTMKPKFGFNIAGRSWYHGTGGGVILVANQILTAERFQFALKNRIAGIFPGAGKMLPIIVHELGHAFGLYHNEITPKSIMGRDLGPPHLQNVGVDLFFDKFECRWLDNHYYFNNDTFVDSSPQFTGEYYYKPVKIGDMDFVEFNINISIQNHLHQAQLVNLWEWNLLDWATFTDDCDTEFPSIDRAKFLVERDLLGTTAQLQVSALDVNGNYMSARIDFNESDLEEDVAAAPLKPIITLTTKWANLKR